MKNKFMKWALLDRVIWPSRFQKVIIALSIVFLVSLFLVCGSFIYFLSAYINLYIQGNQVVRSLQVSADVDETTTALQGKDEYIAAIFPAESRLFFTGPLFSEGEAVFSSGDSVLYAASQDSVPVLKSGHQLSFSTNSNELLIPSEFVGEAGYVNTNNLIGKEVTLSFPVYAISSQNGTVKQTGVDTIVCTIVGTYDSHLTITSPTNGFFVPLSLIEDLRERSGLSIIEDIEANSGVLTQTVIIAKTANDLPKIKNTLVSQGYDVLSLFQWDIVSIGMLFMIAGIMCIISCLASIVLTNKLWFRLLRTQIRELQILYALGLQKNDLSMLLESHYLSLLAGAVIIVLLFVQQILRFIGRNLLESAIATTVFNPVTLISLIICVCYSIWIIRHHIKRLESLDDNIS